MKTDGIILKLAKASGKLPRGTFEVGASGRHKHYGRLGPGEEEEEEEREEIIKHCTKRLFSQETREDGEKRAASERRELYKY